MRGSLPDDAHGDGGAARGSDPDPVTALFEVYLEAAENGSPLDAEALLRRAGPAADRLAARIRAYDMVQRLAEEFGAEEASSPQPFAIGRFQVLRLLGEGGLGRVFLAEDSALGRLVALKVLDPLQGLEATERGYVLNEARSLARLEHPGIVRIFEIQAGVGGRPDSIAMEYIAGPTLARVIAELRAERDGAARAEGDPDPAGRPPAAASELPDPSRTLCTAVAGRLASYSARAACLLRVAEALAYCHDRGVLHRDIKPANVLFDAQAEPRLVDFGLAHLADRGDDARIDVTQRFVGTPAYVAPEQVESGRTGADPRSDVFSFGTLAYEFLTLVSPFARPTRHQTLESVREATPLRLGSLAPAVPPDLQRIVHRCLERDPDERYPSALHLAQDLRALHEQRPLPFAGSSGARVLRLWTRRHRRRLAGAGLALVIALAAVLSASISVAQARHARLRAGLERIDQRLGELARPAAEGPAAHGVQRLRAAGEGLMELTGIAADLDESTLQRWIFGSNQPLLGRSRGLWSGLLARHIAADEQRSQLAGVPFQWVTWKDLVALDSRLGEGEASREYGARGSLELHASLGSLGDPALYAQVRFGQGLGLGYPVYRAVEPVAHPVPGSYRVLVWDAQSQVAFEREVVQLSGWEPPRSIGLAPLDLRPRASAKAYARSSFAIEQLHLGPETPAARLHLPAFRLSAHVNVREFRAFTAATKRDLPPLVADAADEDLPAYVSWREAADYCDWVGGRLPACLELAAAQTQGLDLWPDWPPLHAEWVLDLDPYAGVTQALAFKHALHAANPTAAPMTWVALSARDVVLFMTSSPEQTQRTGLLRIGTAFRIAFSADTRAVFEAQSGTR